MRLTDNNKLTESERCSSTKVIRNDHFSLFPDRFEDISIGQRQDLAPQSRRGVQGTTA
jgi:hypothetical protein